MKVINTHIVLVDTTYMKVYEVDNSFDYLGFHHYRVAYFVQSGLDLMVINKEQFEAYHEAAIKMIYK